MGERLIRAWRVVRRPPPADEPGFADTPSRLAIASAGWRRAGRDDWLCSASGWQMRTGCIDGRGSTICPLCSQRVRTEPDAVANRDIAVIQAHCA